jgi:uncharacterized iron-regulated membrane protein
MRNLSPRAYNIVFHTHTVSGILISVILFVIFFAGAFSLYRQEIYQWENPEARIPVIDDIDYERLIYRLNLKHPGVNDADEIRMIFPTSAKPVYTIYVPITDSSGATVFFTFEYNPVSDSITDFSDKEEVTVGNTLYRLHYLDQLPLYIGRYIAGIVALFFVFAVFTGVLIHWKNIVSKFYAFSFKNLKKQFWQNAHTVFAVIGLPFQLMYAVTGAFYMLSLLVLLPTVLVLYDGNQDKLLTTLFPAEAFHEHHQNVDDNVTSTYNASTIASGISMIKADYPGYTMEHIELINPGTNHTLLGAELVDTLAFNRYGTVVFDLTGNTYRLQLPPGSKNYQQSLLQGITRLHFGNFGGLFIKAIYFILSIFTCFVIISGVLIWKEARNKPAYTPRQRRFHHRVTITYLSVCFSLFPATAILFIGEQLFAAGMGHSEAVNTLFFASWLVLSIAGYLLKTEKQILRWTLISAGILGCCVPVIQGAVTGDWFWTTAIHQKYVFMTDLVWLITGMIALLMAFRLRGIAVTNR